MTGHTDLGAGYSASSPEALLGLRRPSSTGSGLNSRDDIESAESKIFKEDPYSSLFDSPEDEEDEDE